MTTRKPSGRISPTAARGMRIAVVVSRYNKQVTARLLRGARECLRRQGARPADLEIVYCPGAFELPQAANHLARTRSWDAIICLGAVIRGETPHFNFVASECVRGIQTVALTHGLPVLFGVLTTDTLKQAMERAGGTLGNKGWEVALAAVEMVRLFRRTKRSRL